MKQCKSNTLLTCIFCSSLCLTDLSEPKKIGSNAIITRLPYATATPSGLDGVLTVPLLMFSEIFFNTSVIFLIK